jgi:outer membrane protein TolC
VRAEVDAQVAELQRLQRTLERQQGTALPLAEERARVALASYQSGRADLGAVLGARKAAVEARLRAVDLQGQLLVQRARLSYLFAE